MPGGTTVGQIALELSLNKDGFTRDLGDVLGTARSTGANLAKIFQGTGRSITKGMTNAIGGVTNQIAGMARKAAGLLAVAFSTREIVNFSKACIELGSNLAEVQNVVDVTFGGASRTIDKFAKDAADSFGLSELAAKRYSSTIGAMFKSMGIAGDQVTEMSVKIAELAGDMASFYNLDADEAFDKIRSGIAGITMPLQQLGISLNEANLEAYALANGFGTAYNKMSQAEKAIVRYQYLLSVTADAQGDFARTSNSWANQVRVLQLRLEALRATIGQGLINALLPVIRVINVILAKLQRLAEAFRNFTKYIFGNAGGSGGSGTASAVSSISDSIGTAAVGAGDLATGMQDTADAAKTALKWLAPFDELNVLNSDAGGGAGGGAGGPLADLAGLMDDAGTDFLGDLADVIEEDGPSRFTEAVKRAIERGDWYGVGELFAQKLNSIVAQWDAYGDGLKLGEKIKNALEALNGFLETFNFYDLGSKVGDWLAGMMDGVTPEEIASTIANAINAGVSGVSGLTDELNRRNVPAKIGQAIGTAFANFDWNGLVNLGRKILTGIVSLVNSSMSSFISNGGPEKLQSAAIQLGQALGKAFADIEWTDLANILRSVLNSIVGMINSAVSTFSSNGGPEKIHAAMIIIGQAIGTAFADVDWEGLSNLMRKIVTGVATMFKEALSTFVDNGGPEKLKEALISVGTAIGEAFASLSGEDIAAVINSISEGLLGMFKAGFDAFTNGGGWKELWDGLKSLSLESWGLLALPVTIELVKDALKLLGISIAGKVLNGGNGSRPGTPTPPTTDPTGAGAYSFGDYLKGALGVFAIKNFADRKTAQWYANNPNYKDITDAGYKIKSEAGMANTSTPGGNGIPDKIFTSGNSYFWNNLKGCLSNTWKGVKDWFSNAGTKLNDTVEEISEEIRDVPEGYKNGLSDDIKVGAGGGGGNPLFKSTAVRNAMYDPFKGTIVDIGRLLDTSDVPAKAGAMATKAADLLKNKFKAGNVPKAFDEEATASANKFGSHDYSSGGQKAVDDIKTGMERADLPGKMTSLREGLLSKLREGDYEGNGKNIMDRTGNGIDAVNLPQKIANTAASMLHSLRWAGWENVGAQIGDAAGANFKPHFNKHLQTNITLYGSGGTPLTTVFAVPYANGGFVQGGLFLAGEVPGKTEMVGNINGRTGVASGQEITGIGDAIRETSNDEVMLLREQNRLLQALLVKDPFGTPNSNAGRWISQSQQAYKAVTG